MKEKIKNKKSLLIIGIVLAVMLVAVCVIPLVLNSKGGQDAIEYLKRVVYTQKLEDLGNPSKDVGVMLTDCDSPEPFKNLQNAKVTNRSGRYVQGTGAFANMKFQNELIFGVWKQGVDISKYEKGSVHLSVFVGDMDCLTDGINFELASNGVCDSDELQWIMPLSKLKEGWNEFYLSIPDAMTSGKPDLTNINYFRAYTVNPTMGVTVILDNIYATDTEGVAYEPDPTPLKKVVPDGYKETTSPHGKMIMSCNTVNVFEALDYVEVTMQKGEFKEGTGAFKTVGLQNLLLAGKFAKPIDLSEYKEGLVHVSLYINDVSLLKDEIFMELTSSGTWDADEYNWAIAKADLKNGWNELYLPFSNAVVTGKPNLKAIDFVRFFTVGQKEGLVTIFDDVYATNEGAKDSGTETTSPYGEMIASCNTINVFRWVNYVEVTTKKGEFVEGSGAFKTTGYQDLLLEGVLAKDKNLSAYKDGSVHVSLYVSDTALLKDEIFLEITSSGVCDKDEYNWAINKKQLKNGWNELYLPFSSATKTGSPDLKAIDFIRMFTVGQKKGLVTIIDNIYATNQEGGDATGGGSVEGETTSPYGLMIASCNTTELFKAINFVEKTSKSGEYVEGTGAFKTVGKENLLIEATLANPVNISKYQNGYIHVSFYINDKANLTEDVFFEMTSSGVCDVDEYNWTIGSGQLKNGWNDLYLSIGSAAVTGNPNVKKINFFRAFTLNRKDAAVTIFDNIYATNSKYTDNGPDITCTEAAGEGDIMLSNCLCYYSSYSNMKLSANSKEGAYALKVTKPAEIMQGTFAKAVNVSNYKNGYIHIWLYVNDPAYLNNDMKLVLSSAGSDSNNKCEWTIQKSGLSSGWNEIFLSVKDAKVTGTPDFAALNYFGLSTSKPNSKLSFMLDDVRATNTK